MENNKFLTKDKVSVIIKNAPTGTNPEEIINGLVSRGYKLEGFNDQPEPQVDTGLQGFATGVGKGIASTVKGAGQLGESIGRGVLGGVESLTGLPVTPKETYSEQALQQNAQQGGVMGKLLNEQNLTPNSTSETIGKTAEQIAEYALPGSKVSKISKAATTGEKIAGRALSSGTVASTQSGEVGTNTLIAAGTEVALPIVGSLTKNLIIKPLSRIIKGLGAGTSGGSVQDIENILKDPKTAQEISNVFKNKGNQEILKSEADTIMSGVSKIRKEASTAFGQGLDELKSTDINPKVFRTGIQDTLDNFGSVLKNGKRELSNVEFSDPKNIKKANELISKLQNVNLDGKSLRKLSDDIENSLYKTATSDERISFNKFVQQLSTSLKNVISETTPKLGEINKKYSQDIQLADAIQSIFGDVKFKNLEEINNMAKKISGVASDGGISPEIIDNFFNRIGKSSQEFKTGESVRKILSKTNGGNKMGLNFSEITQTLTGGIITPKTITNIAIMTGKSEPYIKSLLEKTAPTARASVIKSLITSKK